ncbi:hypothetical protein HDF16_004629 [Granulicella aggregans]|uniref:Uncharacterized protein n=1 Tax=Granulicella aggregans TaxID=474949 RepID=A0A7W8E748_9BACT|nr:hypothetical protein [Granulicella aggregans]
MAVLNRRSIGFSRIRTCSHVHISTLYFRYECRLLITQTGEGYGVCVLAPESPSRRWIKVYESKAHCLTELAMSRSHHPVRLLTHFIRVCTKTSPFWFYIRMSNPEWGGRLGWWSKCCNPQSKEDSNSAMGKICGSSSRVSSHILRLIVSSFDNSVLECPRLGGFSALA